MTTLVTGATGFIGHEVARQLAAAGERPRLVVRRRARGPLLHGLDADIVHADLRAPETLARAVAGCDRIIHLAGRAVFEPARKLVDSFVHGTRHLAEAAADAGVEHLLFASSLLVHAPTDEPITADTPPDPVTDYGRTKWFVERKLAAFGARTGLAVGSVRLPHVYGPTDQLFGRVHRRVLLVPGRTSRPYAHLHVTDAARALIRASEQRWQGASAIGDAQPAGWDEVLGHLQARMPDLRVVRVPESLARVGTTLLAPAVALRRQPTLQTVDAVRSWNFSMPVAPDALWPQLGITPRYPTYREGIDATLDSYVAFRWRHPVEDRSR
ncbi:NAD-dependent epimerase/dehydratase family protein [Egicoccus halophilus]|uniref:Epimerase n=1 Tax=Egicoccus halophilus TaxID=1670830 RepID=A0A8J3ABC6_9ACTN|nr:NAD(P)-dependent oxidoreductase [Egicoccus halophilus]GGI04003.1 epimerase [Egicoccus halophilus]